MYDGLLTKEEGKNEDGFYQSFSSRFFLSPKPRKNTMPFSKDKRSVFFIEILFIDFSRRIWAGARPLEIYLIHKEIERYYSLARLLNLP